ncbi:MAG: helix-turn-helix domain-containing protein [Gemmatimonadetes bacterium]|nr:helix-turn-helix domain-containing protein [Gemmatimonadota bacterium]MXX70457.1 helix-turn-helix domain-containing protein [Gemmatimonadota bacterium]MYG34664.1 helix-turn-helix domain-containing protein [Gemmatimonadota bacterium]
MHGIEKRIQMRRYIEAGVSKAATARAVGISRRTLYNWIESGELERDPDDMKVEYGPRPPRPSKLDPWKARIAARLSVSPRLTAAELFREVSADDYRGGYGQVKRYVQKVRREILNGK